MKRLPQPGWAAWLSLFGLVLGTLFLAIGINASSDRKWCSVVETLDQAYQETPPTTPAGQNLARDIHDLRTDLGCGGGSR